MLYALLVVLSDSDKAVRSKGALLSAVKTGEPIAVTSMQNFRSALKSQYHAALAMLREAIERCPDEEWLSRDHKNAFWQVAYHVLFFTHLYLQPNEAAFVLWSQHRGADDGTTGEPYSKAQVLEY